MADASIDEATKRARIKALIDAKNQRHQALLTPAQQTKIIPTTERETTVKQPVGKKQ
jgi:hypothetical protein